MQKLLKAHDIVLIQEHWFFQDEISSLSNIIPDSFVYGKSQMSERCLLEGRPYGGCAFLWGSSFKHLIEPVETESSRLCGIKCLMGDMSLLIFNVYMPCDTTCNLDNKTEFVSILEEISNICTVCNSDYIIIGGDFNTDLEKNLYILLS